MHLPWPARQYERTCADCGCTWSVPRYFARRHALAIFNPPFRGQAAIKSDAAVQAAMNLDDQAESLRRCPKCSSVHYSQRPVRS